MILLPSKRILTSQPQGLSNIDFPGLICGVVGTDNRDLATGNVISSATSISKGVVSNEQRLIFPGSQSSGAYPFVNTASKLGGATNLVILLKFNASSLASEAKIISAWGTSGQFGFLVGVDNVSSKIQLATWDTANAISLIRTAQTVSTNSDITLVVRWRPGSGSTKFFVNGIDFGTDYVSSDANYPINYSAGNISLGVADDGGPLSGSVAIALVSTNYKFDDAYLLSLSDNPWQLFKSTRLIFIQDSAGGGDQSLTPSLFSNTNSFYSATLSNTNALTPALFTNTNTFHAPTVSRGVVNLTPSLYTNSNTFYTHTVSTGAAPQNLTASLFTNNNTFYTHTVSSTRALIASLYSNTNTFYSPIVSAGGSVLQPSLYANVNTFYTHTLSKGAVFLTASLFTNNNTFYAHTLTKGAVNLTASLFVNTNSFYSPTVSGAGALYPGLFTNSNTFYNHTLTPGAVGLTVGLLSNTNAFYTHTISTVGANQDLTPSLFVNSSNFYIATVSSDYAITAQKLDNINSFYSATVSRGAVNLTPALLTNTNIFYHHGVGTGLYSAERLYQISAEQRNYIITAEDRGYTL